MGGFSQRTRKVCSVPRDSERGRKGSGKIQRGAEGEWEAESRQRRAGFSG